MKIDERTKKSREEFTKGFVKGTSFSLAAYSLYSLIRSAAYVADSNITAPKTPANTVVYSVAGQQCTPATKPGFKPLTEEPKGIFINGASGICVAATQSGDFYLGLAFSALLILAGILMNRRSLN